MGFAISGLLNRYQVIVQNNGKVAVFNPQRTLPCYAILSTCTAPYFAFVAMTKHQFSIDQNNVIARSASPDYNAPTGALRDLQFEAEKNQGAHRSRSQVL